jgi:BMFP domain-containing protein YqiC
VPPTKAAGRRRRRAGASPPLAPTQLDSQARVCSFVPSFVSRHRLRVLASSRSRSIDSLLARVAVLTARPAKQQIANSTPHGNQPTVPAYTPPPAPNRFGSRHELAKLERRMDRLEFELRKSMHQIQIQSQQQSAAGEVAGGGQPPATLLQLGAPAAQGGGGATGPADPSAHDDPKLIDLGERLDLVEKFITITTGKVSSRRERARPRLFITL